jgi:hypothetical protein
VLSPAGIQATRIVQLWNLTLIVCSLVRRYAAGARRDDRSQPAR